MTRSGLGFGDEEIAGILVACGRLNETIRVMPSRPVGHAGTPLGPHNDRTWSGKGDADDAHVGLGLPRQASLRSDSQQPEILEIPLLSRSSTRGHRIAFQKKVCGRLERPIC